MSSSVEIYLYGYKHCNSTNLLHYFGNNDPPGSRRIGNCGTQLFSTRSVVQQLGAQTLVLDHLGSNPGSITCWMSIGKLFILSKPQFPVLRRGNDKVHTSEDCCKDKQINSFKVLKTQEMFNKYYLLLDHYHSQEVHVNQQSLSKNLGQTISQRGRRLA